MSLKIDFFESGIGETILITFPDGKLGIVDAHPSSTGLSEILKLINGGEIEFVCLTHPHKDHGQGLIELMDTLKVNAFWHTVAGLNAWIYGLEEITTYPSYIQEAVEKFMAGSGDFLREVYGIAALRKIKTKRINSSTKSETVGGVKIHFIGPEEVIQNQFDTAQSQRALGKRKKLPDPNLLSAIFALEYGENVVILGGDALISNWRSAATIFKNSALPKARLIKIPHHGAHNAFNLRKRDDKTYLDLCEIDAKGVLFAGDALHPDAEVMRRLEKN